MLLYLCLSNDEILVLRGLNNEVGEESSDWRKIAVIKPTQGKSLQQIELQKSSNIALRYEDQVLLFRRSRVKVFVEPDKKLVFVQKTLNTIEYGDGTGQGQNEFIFPSKIKDFLVHDNHVVILDSERQIYHFPLQELINKNTKLKPVLSKFSSSFDGQFKGQGFAVEGDVRKVILTKHGYCGIVNQRKMIFVSYSNEPLLQYRVSRKEEYFIDIVLNSTHDVFALVNNEFQMKIFQTSAKNIKILHEGFELLKEIKEFEKQFQ